MNDTLKLSGAEEEPIERVSILLDRIRDWKGLGGLVSSTVVIPNYDSYVAHAPYLFFSDGVTQLAVPSPSRQLNLE